MRGTYGVVERGQKTVTGRAELAVPGTAEFTELPARQAAPGGRAFTPIREFPDVRFSICADAWD
jgi:hypothetical protein